MKFANLFKPKWQHHQRAVRISALARISDAPTLRRIAQESDDERLRLMAASRLNDQDCIKAIARCAAEESVRLDAALETRDQSCLTAVALDEWSIQRGLKAVERITNAMLLRRIARSAKQDAIRLAAALKMDHPDLLKQVARSSNLIEIHWQVAKKLNDPILLAEITQFKPGNRKMGFLRRKAKQKLMDYLDACQNSGDLEALVDVIQSVPHLSFKLEAFMRLPAEAITSSVLQRLADQDYRYIPARQRQQLLARIGGAHWRTRAGEYSRACIHCNGSGNLALKCISRNNNWYDRGVFPCPECNGQGERLFKHVTCHNQHGACVVFEFPLIPGSG